MKFELVYRITLQRNAPIKLEISSFATRIKHVKMHYFFKG